MKKFFLFASLALVLASCSSEAEEAVIKPNETPEEEVADLVEIKLGGTRASASTEASTRAAHVISAFNDTKVGIYAVDDATSDPFAMGTVAANGITEAKTVILNNVVSTAEAPSGNISKINLSIPSDHSGMQKWYYPRSINAYCYTFFGYYPYSENAAIASNGDSISIPGTFDGSEDVMMGKSDPVDNGYNAKYYRDNTVTNHPEIKFKHMTAQIELYFKKGAGEALPDNYVVQAYFREPTKYNLVINRDCSNEIKWSTESSDSAYVYAVGEPYNENKVYNANEYVTSGENLYQITGSTNGNGQPIGDVADTSNGIEPVVDPSTGYPVFVATSQNLLTKTLYVKLADGTVSEVPINAPQDITPRCFAPGYKYKVVLTINGPQEILVNASVEEWTEVGQNINGEI